MKKLLLLALAIACVTLLKAQPKTSQTRLITMSDSYEKVKVGDDVKVVLTEGLNKTITVTGKPEVILTVANGVLSVKKQLCCKPGPVIVYIPVQGLKSVEMNEGSSAFSNGQLQSDNLTVFVKGASYFDLKSRGSINVVYDDPLELDIRKVKNQKLLTTSVNQ